MQRVVIRLQLEWRLRRRLEEHDQDLSRTVLNFCKSWNTIPIVKNVQSPGVSNTALSMIFDNPHKAIGQNFSVIKHDHILDPNDWKT